MPLEQQLASLTLSQRLKELGVKQESLFTWVTFDSHSVVDHTTGGYKTMRFTTLERMEILEEYEERGYPEVIEFCSAFTVAELGEMLPDYTQELGNLEISKCETDHFNMKKKEKGWWNVSYWTWKNAYSKNGDIYLERESKHLQQADTEADCRAKMLIYLLERKLITL